MQAIGSLQGDLKEKKINQNEFNFLLGVLFKKEINDFIDVNVNSIFPQSKNDGFSQMTFLHYSKRRKLNHV